MAAKRYELSDGQWEQIKDMFPKAKTVKPPKDNRLMLNAILWLARSGAAWADIPERYGPHQTVYCGLPRKTQKNDMQNAKIPLTSYKIKGIFTIFQRSVVTVKPSNVPK